MIVRREDLEAIRACVPGLAWFDTLDLAEQDYTPAHQVWMMLAAPGYWSWCVARGVLPLLSMAGEDLRGLVFFGCTIVGGDFAGADLRGARLVGCDLSGCTFENADLDGCSFEGTTLLDCSL
jgi:uncharacterized protein YjbI with pentapeptide repeats